MYIYIYVYIYILYIYYIGPGGWTRRLDETQRCETRSALRSRSLTAQPSLSPRCVRPSRLNVFSTRLASPFAFIAASDPKQ